MPLGLVVLFAVAALVYFGLAHRVLDRMRLTDTQALAFLGLMVAGSFVTIPLSENERAATVSVNVGGALIPLALAVYLLAKAGTRTEVVRALASAAGTAAGIVLVSMYIDTPPHDRELWIDPVWLYSLLGGVLAYAAGRSRRAAFVAGTLGVLLADVVHLFRVAASGVRSEVALGGAGVFDAVVLAGVLSVTFAEVFGESRERLQGGPRQGEDRPEALVQDEGVASDGGGGDQHE